MRLLKPPSGRYITIDHVTRIGNEQGNVVVKVERNHRIDLDTRSDVEARHQWLQVHAEEIPALGAGPDRR